MPIIDLLRKEQIALMRYSASTTPTDLARHRRSIDAVALLIADYSYPNRPYIFSTMCGVAIDCKHLAPAHGAALASSENEG